MRFGKKKNKEKKRHVMEIMVCENGDGISCVRIGVYLYIYVYIFIFFFSSKEMGFFVGSGLTGL